MPFKLLTDVTERGKGYGAEPRERNGIWVREGEGIWETEDIP